MSMQRGLGPVSASVVVVCACLVGLLCLAGCGDETPSEPRDTCTGVQCGHDVSCSSGGAGCVSDAVDQLSDCADADCGPDTTEPLPGCADRALGGDETDVDCGGSCGPCANEKSCASGADCTSGVCDAQTCMRASCADGVQNQDETGIDSGGACTPLPGDALVTLNIEEPAGVAQASAPVRSGVPLPRGLVNPDEALALVASDETALPLQLRVLSRWDDGSVRWLLLDSQIDLNADESRDVELRRVEEALTISNPLVVSDNATTIDVNTGPLQVTIPKGNGSLLQTVVIDGVTVLDAPTDATDRGPWVSTTDADFFGANLLSTSTPVANAPILGYRTAIADRGVGPFHLVDPWDLSVTVEEQGPLHAVVRVSGAHLDGAGDDFCTFITRLHLYRGRPDIRVEHTITYTGDGNDPAQRIVSYGVRLPLQGSDTLVEDASVATGVVEHLRFDEHSVAGTTRSGQALGVLARGDGSVHTAVLLADMAENYPKALEATADGLEVQLYPASAGPWNLTRYNTDTNANGETSGLDGNRNKGAQGLAKTDAFVVRFASAAVAPGDLQQAATALQAGPLLALASPQWVSDARVLGFGAFIFDAALNANEVHYRLDRQLRVVADFMRVSQRKEFGWYGMENYGDIRGLVTNAGSSDQGWSELGRYGWSGNSGEPSNQLWLQFFRKPSRAVYRDAEALARHTLDVQMIHYGDADSQGDTAAYSGRNRERAVGSLHRHGQQAWSGYGNSADYSHVAGVETYYYLTGSGRARETLYEAAQFVRSLAVRTARKNGLDILSRTVAVFHDQPEVQSAFQARLDELTAYLTEALLDDELDGNGEPPFEFFVRMAPGILYHHERTGELEDRLLYAADKVVANTVAWGELDTRQKAQSLYLHHPLLAYAAGLAGAPNHDAYMALAKAAAELHCHTVEVGSITGAIPLEALQNIPDDWRTWRWEWTDGTVDASAPGILWVARQIAFRNSYIQDYHIYRAFPALAMLGAVVGPETAGLQAR